VTARSKDDSLFSATAANEWPLVGRAEELDLLREMQSARPQVSAVIAGQAGVGKSRVARAATEEAALEGWATLSIRGSEGYSQVPLGPLRTVLRLTSSTELSGLEHSVERELMAMRTRKGLIVMADDCQSLDESAAVTVTTPGGTSAKTKADRYSD
jgi:predicted ATP-dependent serine protease